MPEAGKILFIFFMMSVFLYIGGFYSPAMVLFGVVDEGGITGDVELYNMLTITGLLGGAVGLIAVGLRIISPKDAILLSIISTFIVFFTLPISFMGSTGMPLELKLIFGGGFSLLFIFSMVSLVGGRY